MLPRSRRRVFRIPPDRAAEIDRELQDELTAHLDLCIAKFESDGLPRDEAERRARARFEPNEDILSRLQPSARRRERQVRRRDWLGGLSQDIRFALRRLRSDARLTSVVICMLALAIGANAGTLQIAERLLLDAPSSPPAAEYVARLLVGTTIGPASHSSPFLSLAGYRALRSAQAVAMAGAYTPARERTYVLDGKSGTLRYAGATSSLFDLLGAQAMRGRLLTPADDSTSATVHAAIVSAAFWRAHDVAIGSRVRIGQDEFTIAGVAPPNFVGAEVTRVDVWIPLENALQLEFTRTDYELPDFVSVRALVRLRSTIPRHTAERELTAAYRAALGASQTRVTLASIVPQQDDDYRAVANTSLLVWIVSAMVLLIACGNVAALLSAREASARSDVAVRLALGITRRRLLQQRAAESACLLIPVLGAAFAVARLTEWLIYHFLLPQIAESFAPSRSVLIAIALMAIIAAAATTVPPIAIALSTSVRDMARDNTPAMHSPGRRRSFFVVLQLGFALVLAIAATLFVRSVRAVERVVLGFDADRLVAAQADLPDSMAASQIIGYWSDAARRVGRIPVVRAVSIATSLPYGDSQGGTFHVDHAAGSKTAVGFGAPMTGVDTAYLTTIGARLAAGRFFTAADTIGGRGVAIVNEQLATSVWGKSSPLGAVLQLPDGAGPVEIVGVISDIKDGPMSGAGIPRVYMPLRQWHWAIGVRGVEQIALLARVDGSVRLASDSIGAVLRHGAPATGVPFVRPVSTLRDRRREEWALGARLLVPLALLALTIALVGIYAVVEYSVVQRRFEWSIRAAMGASPNEIMTLILRQGGSLAFGAILFGLSLAFVLTPRLAPLLFRVGPHDVPAYALAIGLTGVAAFAAIIVPARHAAGAEPAAALRAP